jgi:hypothetical protein
MTRDVSQILFDGLRVLIKQHDRPHGFDDSLWYEQALKHAKACLRIAEQWAEEQHARGDEEPQPNKLVMAVNPDCFLPRIPDKKW